MKAHATKNNAASITPGDDAAPDNTALDVEYGLPGLRDLLGLAAMATEADRVLSDIDALVPHDPALARHMQQIETWRQWSEHRGSLGGALAYMQRIAGAMATRAGVS